MFNPCSKEEVKHSSFHKRLNINLLQNTACLTICLHNSGILQLAPEQQKSYVELPAE